MCVSGLEGSVRANQPLSFWCEKRPIHIAHDGFGIGVAGAEADSFKQTPRPRESRSLFPRGGEWAGMLAPKAIAILRAY